MIDSTVPNRTKRKTLDQVVAMKEKAARFLRDIAGDPDKAAAFDAMSPAEYAGRKRIEIANPPALQIPNRRRLIMPKQTRAELEERLRELEDENEELTDKLDSILDIASDDDDDDDDDEGQDDAD